jgi:hypothetical protein
MADIDLDYAARTAKFFEFERRYALFESVSHGFSPWRVMRHYIFNAYHGYSASVGRTPLPQRLAIAAAGLLRLALLLVRRRRVDVLFKGCASSMRMFERGKWIDPDIDPLIDQGLTALKLVEMNNPAFASNVANARYSVDLQPTIFGLVGRVLARLLPRGDRAFCEQTSALLKAELGFEASADQMMVRISSLTWQSRLYALLLRRCRPDAIVVTDTGEFALQMAAQRLNIPFIEIQHGIFDRLHPDCVPDDIAGSNTHLLIPDALLMRGSYWVEQIQGFRQASVAYAVGSYAIDQAREERLTGAERRQGCHLLVTSQGIARDEVAQWVTGMAAALIDGPQNRISIKLHPVYDDPDSFADLGQHLPNCRTVASSALPNVYQLLADADVHVSISSACHFDALAIGLPTVMLPLQSHESLLYAVDQGYIHLIGQPSEIGDISRSVVDNETMQRFSKSGYAQNVMQLIAELSSGKRDLSRVEI